VQCDSILGSVGRLNFIDVSSHFTTNCFGSAKIGSEQITESPSCISFPLLSEVPVDLFMIVNLSQQSIS
jgi:hypothetical protein